MAPDPFLVKRLTDLKRGNALDIACGQGRNSIFLASKGFSVKGMDISDIGLDRLARFSKENRLPVSTEKIDLENPQLDITNHFGYYDSVIVINYKLSKELFKTIPKLLASRGILLYCTFNFKHHEKHGFNKAFCIEPGEHNAPHQSFKLLHFEDLEQEQQSRDGYVFIKQ